MELAAEGAVGNELGHVFSVGLSFGSRLIAISEMKKRLVQVQVRQDPVLVLFQGCSELWALFEQRFWERHKQRRDLVMDKTRERVRLTSIVQSVVGHNNQDAISQKQNC